MEDNVKPTVSVDAFGFDTGVVPLFDNTDSENTTTEETDKFDVQMEAELMITNPCEMFN